MAMENSDPTRPLTSADIPELVVVVARATDKHETPVAGIITVFNRPVEYILKSGHPSL